MSKLLFRLGIHRPLFNHWYNFTDKVSGKSVYNAECFCGKKCMVDNCFGFFGFKVERKK